MLEKRGTAVQNRSAWIRTPHLLFEFVHVARHGGLRAGAEARGPSASTLARHVAELEADMGVRLMDRDERSFVLTTAGRTLLDRLQGLRIVIRNLRQKLEARGEVGSVIANKLGVGYRLRSDA